MGGLYSSVPTGDLSAMSSRWFPSVPSIKGWTPRFEGDIESGSTMTIGGGLYVQYAINSSLLVQLGAQYRMEALQYIQSLWFSSPGYIWLDRFQVDGRYRYMDFPLLLKYRINIRGDLYPFVFAGPSVSVLLSDYTEGSIGESGMYNDNIKFTAANHTASAVFGMCIGLGATVRSHNKARLGFDVRYRWMLQTALTALEISGKRTRDLDIGFASWGGNITAEVAL